MHSKFGAHQRKHVNWGLHTPHQVNRPEVPNIQSIFHVDGVIGDSIDERPLLMVIMKQILIKMNYGILHH